MSLLSDKTMHDLWVTHGVSFDAIRAIETAVLEAQKQEPWPFSADRVTYPKHERSLGAEKAMASDLRERNAAWWALVMGAAAALEDAANFLSDSDAKRAAEGAANHYRREANALWPNAEANGVPQAARPSEAV